MRTTRTQFLTLAAGAAGAAALSGCTEAVRYGFPPDVPDRLDVDAVDPVVWRVLSRTTFGPRPGDPARVAAMGVDAYVEDQLAADRTDEGNACRLRLGTLDTLDMEADDAKDWETASYPEVGKGPVAEELQQAALIRAVYSERQLREVMVDFWATHFNVSQLKADCSWLKTVDDRLLRKHALGKFRDLVWASAHSPAMLFYLDNDKNRRDPKTGSGTNENYARELLELHTLGVHGDYTLTDVQEVARCFSGWSFKQGLTWRPGDFEFHPQDHDEGFKRVLGVLYPAGQGIRDGERVIGQVCRHPSTARHVARKLVRRFVADRGEEALIGRVARAFQRTDGDLRQVLSVLFHSAEFRRGSARKLKRPFDFAASALRALGANTTGHGALPYLERMGQLPYKWTMPDGYPDRAEAWAPGLLARWNFAIDLVQQKVPGTTIALHELMRASRGHTPETALAGLSRAILGRPLPEPHRERLLRLASGDVPRDPELRQWAALLLASPEFQWR